MITVVIPTYKEPEALDLCLQSAIEGQVNDNQIIVVVDGFFDLNKEVLKKYADKIDILNLEENVGMIKAMNLGHYNAKFDLVFHVQDDNVFPRLWDKYLLESYEPNSVLTPNQIEPTPSMFSQFNIKDLGRDPKTFNLTRFWVYEVESMKSEVKEEGSTFPFLISKNDYLKVGGLDESYPGPWMVDWEFFMKCRMNGMKMLRTYNCSFYHFVSLGTAPSPEKQAEKATIEQACHQYAFYKWGTNIKHNPIDNSKYL
jgi:glycosyltransferase involved in cell wall biosynthesis